MMSYLCWLLYKNLSLCYFCILFYVLIGESRQWRPHRGGLWKLQHSLAATSWDQLSRWIQNRPCYSTVVKHSFNLMHSLIFYSILLLCWGASVGHHVMTTPAPHAGLAVITALNILEGFNITGQMLRNNTFHRTAEVALKQCHVHVSKVWLFF